MSASLAVHVARSADPGALELPIADRAALAVAMGLALAGQPVVAVLDGAGRLGAVTEVLAAAGEIVLAGGFSVPLVVRMPYGAEASGLDGAAGRFVGRLPGVSVVAGSSSARSAGLVRAAVASGRPVVVLESRATDRGDPEEIRLDRAIVERAGDHVVLAAWAGGVAAALGAADRLEEVGISATVLDLVSLAPLDRATLGDAVRRCGRLVVVDPAADPFVTDVHQCALEEAFLYLEAPFARAGADVEAILSAARGCMEF